MRKKLFNVRRKKTVSGTVKNNEGGTIMSEQNTNLNECRVAPTQISVYDVTGGIRFPEDAEKYPCEINISVTPLSTDDDDEPTDNHASVTLKRRMTRTAFGELLHPDVLYDAIDEAESIQKFLMPIAMADKPDTEESMKRSVILEIMAEARQYLPDDVLVTRAVTASYVVHIPRDEADTVFNRYRLCEIRNELRERIENRLNAIFSFSYPA